MQNENGIFFFNANMTHQNALNFASMHLTLKNGCTFFKHGLRHCAFFNALCLEVAFQTDEATRLVPQLEADFKEEFEKAGLI